MIGLDSLDVGELLEVEPTAVVLEVEGVLGCLGLFGDFRLIVHGFFNQI